MISFKNFLIQQKINAKHCSVRCSSLKTDCRPYLTTPSRKDHPTFTQLGRLLGCSRQNIKKLALALEKKGFVTIAPCQQDARASSIYPTSKLNDYFENVFTTYQEDLRFLFEVYSEEEIAQLFRLMMKLYKGIENLESKTGKKEN